MNYELWYNYTDTIILLYSIMTVSDLKIHKHLWSFIPLKKFDGKILPLNTNLKDAV